MFPSKEPRDTYDKVCILSLSTACEESIKDLKLAISKSKEQLNVASDNE